MTQNEKYLLLQDLSSRLPYRVKISVNDKVESLQGINILDNVVEYGSFLSSNIEEVRPYLFPLSSMTEEQKKEYHHIVNYISPDDTENLAEGEFVYVNQIEQLLHFYYKNHLDYRGLIPMGLANDATGLNIY